MCLSRLLWLKGQQRTTGINLGFCKSTAVVDKGTHSTEMKMFSLLGSAPVKEGEFETSFVGLREVRWGQGWEGLAINRSPGTGKRLQLAPLGSWLVWIGLHCSGNLGLASPPQALGRSQCVRDRPPGLHKTWRGWLSYYKCTFSDSKFIRPFRKEWIPLCEYPWANRLWKVSSSNWNFPGFSH